MKIYIFNIFLWLKNNAMKERELAWRNYRKYQPEELGNSMAYLKYARADEKLDTIGKIIKGYVNQVRGGMTI